MSTTTPPLTLDVTVADAQSLRRRLQAQAEAIATSVLPGGAVLEDGPLGLAYQFHTPGVWTLEIADADEIRLSHPAGHSLMVIDGRVRLELAK